MRYHMGGTVSDNELSSSQLRARYGLTEKFVSSGGKVIDVSEFLTLRRTSTASGSYCASAPDIDTPCEIDILLVHLFHDTVENSIS